jgi:hypothetical protein
MKIPKKKNIATKGGKEMSEGKTDTVQKKFSVGQTKGQKSIIEIRSLLQEKKKILGDPLARSIVKISRSFPGRKSLLIACVKKETFNEIDRSPLLTYISRGNFTISFDCSHAISSDHVRSCSKRN